MVLSGIFVPVLRQVAFHGQPAPFEAEDAEPGHPLDLPVDGRVRQVQYSCELPLAEALALLELFEDDAL